MSSTDRDVERQAERLWSESIAPAAHAIAGRDRSLLHNGAEPLKFRNGDGPREGSMFAQMRGEEPELMELELDDVAAQLAALWTREGLPELASMAAPLVQLARELETDEPESAEVSADIYTMY